MSGTSADLPDPESVGRQKREVAKSLDAQLKQGTEQLDQQRSGQLDYVKRTAEQQRKQYFDQVEAQLKQVEFAIEQKYNQQLLTLQQAHEYQKGLLEQQAMALTLEYTQKKAQEETMRK